MKVKCDKCGAKFQLKDEKITDKGVKVRCSKCKNVFTVKKDAKSEPPGKPELSGKQAPPLPPAPESPAATPPRAKGEDDPFSDFNFADDLDFSEGDGPEAPLPKEPEPEPDLASQSPAVSFSEPAPDQGAAENFDFNDEDFSVGDEGSGSDLSDDSPSVSFEEPSPPAEELASPKRTGGEGYGDIKFDEESYADPQNKGSADGGEYGNVSIDHPEGGAAKPDGVGDEFDDVGFGDFQFDADEKLPDRGGDDDLDVVEYQRSPSSKAPVGDDYEASIGDSEPEPESAARRSESAEPASPPPPKPAIKRPMAEKSGAGKVVKILVALVIIILAAVVGAVMYLNSLGLYSFGDLFSGDFAKLGKAYVEWQYVTGRKERPMEGKPRVVKESMGGGYIERGLGQDKKIVGIYIYGEVINDSNKPLKNIEVHAKISNQETGEVFNEWSYCGVTFDANDLKELSPESLQANMHFVLEEDTKIINPGETCVYNVVFFNLASNANAEVPDGKWEIVK